MSNPPLTTPAPDPIELETTARTKVQRWDFILKPNGLNLIGGVAWRDICAGEDARADSETAGGVRYMRDWKERFMARQATPAS